MSFSKELKNSDWLEGYTFRRMAYGMAHAYLRGSSATNEQRVLEIANDAPDHARAILQIEHGPFHYLHLRGRERPAPVNKKRDVKSFRMTPDEAAHLEDHLGLDFSNDTLSLRLIPTPTSITISKGKSEPLWHFRVYDPVRPLLEIGFHSLAQIEADPDTANEQRSKLESAKQSAQALDILKDVLGNEKAEFVCTAKDRDTISFLIPEHLATKLAKKLKSKNISFSTENPVSAIDEISEHSGPAEHQGRY